MTREEILKAEWSISDSRKGVATFARFMAENVMPWDMKQWVSALAENHADYSGWETDPRVIDDFINDMLF